LFELDFGEIHFSILTGGILKSGRKFKDALPTGTRPKQVCQIASGAFISGISHQADNFYRFWRAIRQ
jgi:hypothetical protein